MEVDYGKLQPRLLWQLPFADTWPTSVAFLADGRLAAGDQQGRILIWNIALDPTSGTPADGKTRLAPATAPERMLAGHTNGITRLCASPDGRRLYSASLDRTVRIWNLDSATSGTAETTVDPPASEQRKTKLPTPAVTVPTQAAEKILAGHDDWVSALALSADGKRLISGDYAARVIVWDATTGAEVKRWSGLAWNWIVSLALTADGSTALVSEFRVRRDDFDNPAAAVRLYEVASGQETLDVLKTQFPKYERNETSYGAAQTWRKYTGDGLIAAAFSPDDTYVALAQGGEIDKGSAHLLEAKTGKAVRDLASHLNGMTDLGFSAAGKYLLSTGRDTCLRITNVADGKEVLQLGTPRGGQFKDWFSACARSSDECYLAAADIAGWVHVWSMESAK